jgi:predicted metal-dependent enzyme (double-stranded beta helix superfamily)
LGNAREALLTTGSGLVGSKTADFLKNRKAWSWSAWVRPDNLSPTAPGNFYSEGNNGLSGHVSIYQGKIMVQLWNESASPNWGSVTTDVLLSLGTWSHVAVTFEAPEGSNVGTCSIYHDGQLVKSTQLPYLRVSGALGAKHEFAIGMNVGFYVGNQTSAPYRFDGAIDEMLIFDRALTEAEVSRLRQIDDRLRVSPAIELHFQTVPGQNYRLQWSTDLKTWTDHGEIVTGTGAEFSVPVSIRSAAERFWRLDPIQ